MLVQSGHTPLHVAVGKGNVEMVKALLSAGAKKEAATPVSGTPSVGHVCTHMCLMSGERYAGHSVTR